MCLPIHHVRNCKEPCVFTPQGTAHLCEITTAPADLMSLRGDRCQKAWSTITHFLSLLSVSRHIQELNQQWGLQSQRLSCYRFKLSGRLHLLAFAVVCISPKVPFLSRMSGSLKLGFACSLWYLHHRMETNNAISVEANRVFQEHNRKARAQTTQDEQIRNIFSQQIVANAKRKKALVHDLVAALHVPSQASLLLSKLEKIKMRNKKFKTPSFEECVEKKEASITSK